MSVSNADAPEAQPIDAAGEPAHDRAMPVDARPAGDAPDGEATVPVTFFANAEGAESATLVGEFNEWSVDATPMSKVGDLFEVTVALEAGRTHRYKFLIDGTRWENDPHADDYVANEYGGHDSVKQL